ncbi:hypothetical protein K443DRAFT_284472, partial [Laccaria amethystina LaAM-08-1]
PTVLPSHHLAPIISLHIRIHTQDVLDLESHKIINVKLVCRIHFSQDTSQAPSQYAAHTIICKHADITGLIELHQ